MWILRIWVAVGCGNVKGYMCSGFTEVTKVVKDVFEVRVLELADSSDFDEDFLST